MASDELVDFNELAVNHAKILFKATKTKEQARIPDDALEYRVNWDKVKFTHKPPIYGGNTMHKPDKPETQILFSTTFVNKTGQEQAYSFKTERTTSSSCNLEVERGVMLGQELGLKIQTPCEVFEASAGFKREISLNNCAGETHEEELTWGVDSQIKVPAKHKTIAKLVVTEEQYASEYLIKTECKGRVLINVTNTRDNNSLLKVIEIQISEIIKHAQQKQRLPGVTQTKNTVSYETKGKCHFRYAVEQYVKIKEKALSDYEVEDD